MERVEWVNRVSDTPYNDNNNEHSLHSNNIIHFIYRFCNKFGRMQITT